MKVDKTLVASVALHVLVLGWGLVSFSSKAFESVPEESLPVEIISSDQLAKVTAGMKSGKKEVKTPLVEKVADAKPIDDTVGKIDDKKPPVVTDTTPPPQPKPIDKPDDKAAADAKAAAEAKAAADAAAKADEKAKAAAAAKIEAEALQQAKAEADAKAQADAKARAEAKAKADADAKAKAEAKAMMAESKKAERTFDQTKIAALLDKRDPTRASATGATLNSNAALGLAHGQAADNSATWGSMFKEQVNRCWKKPYGGIEAQMAEAEFSIKLKRDGSLEATPVATHTPASPFLRVYQESALRAIIDCAPYRLPAAFFDEWKYFEPVFSERSS